MPYLLASWIDQRRLLTGVIIREGEMRWLMVLMAAFSLVGCFSYSSTPSPTVVVPHGATVICPNGSPATGTNGAYSC